MLWYRLDRKDAALTRQNLTHVLGNRLSTPQIGRTARHVFHYVALNKLIHAMLPELTLQDLNRLLSIQGAEHLENALARDQGVVLLGTHFGFPGYLPLIFLERMGYPVAGILGEEIEPDASWAYRNLVNPIRRRARHQLRLIEPIGTPQRQMASWLQQNQILLILGDVLDEEVLRLPPPHVLPAPLLGHKLLLKTGPFRLARWLKTPLVLFFIVPKENAFSLIIEPPLPMSDDNSRAGLMADLAGFTARFEPYLLRHPAMWAHWRHRQLSAFMLKRVPGARVKHTGTSASKSQSGDRPSRGLSEDTLDRMSTS